MKNQHRKVLELLQHGRKNSIKSDVFAKVLDCPTESNIAIREIIRELVEVYGFCIGSNNQGYYLIDDSKDLEETARDLQSRSIAMLTRRSLLIKNYQHEKNLNLEGVGFLAIELHNKQGKIEI